MSTQDTTLEALYEFAALIRAGNTHPQCGGVLCGLPTSRGYYRQAHDNVSPERTDIATCALGGAYFALTGRLPTAEQLDRIDLGEAFGSLLELRVPVDGLLQHHDTTIALDSLVTALNDVLGWTRDQIADYIEKEAPRWLEQ